MDKYFLLPQYLSEHKNEILIGFGKEKPSKYVPDRWLQEFKADQIITKDLKYIINKYPLVISRHNLVALAKKAISGGYEEIRRLFLATMIWGWMEDNPRRGSRNIKKCTNDPSFRKVLKESWKQVMDGSISNAYDKFVLPGCGVAFFTKFFYFIGLVHDISPLPIIFDSKVAKSLDFICREEGWNFKDFAYVERKEGKISFVNRHAQGYVNYVMAMDKWANKLGCRADNIEYFMYTKGSELENTKSLSGKKNGGSMIGKRVEVRVQIRKAEFTELKQKAGANVQIEEYIGLLIARDLKEPTKQKTLLTNDETDTNGSMSIDQPVSTDKKKLEEAIRKRKEQLAEEYITDPKEKKYFLKTSVGIHNWGCYISGLLLKENNAMPFTSEAIKEILKQLLKELYNDRSLIRDDEVQPYDVACNCAEKAKSNKFPCLKIVARDKKEFKYEFLGFKEALELKLKRYQGDKSLRQALTDYEQG